ncbi:MAG TPA: hypothetical protein PLM75_05420 [bacterium]|nr:hypothetical protein [bacterium]HPP87282.1 hypothetical protein [bacterium]
MKTKIAIGILIILLLFSIALSFIPYHFEFDFDIDIKVKPSAAKNNYKEYYKILIVDSYHPQFLISQLRFAGLLKKLIEYDYIDKKYSKKIFEKTNTFDDYYKFDQLEIKRIWLNSKEYMENFEIVNNIEKVVQCVNDYKPNLIMLSEDDAVEKIGTYYFGSDIPIIFWGLNTTPLKYDIIRTPNSGVLNVSGVYQKELIFETLELYQKIFAKDKIKILFVSEKSNTTNFKIKYIMENKQFYPQYEFIDFIVDNDFEKLKNGILKYSAQKDIDVIFCGAMGAYKDKSGRLLEISEVFKWLIENTKKPLLSSLKSYINNGALLGVCENEEEQGELAAERFNDFVNNKNFRDLNILYNVKNLKFINPNALKKYNDNLKLEDIKIKVSDIQVLQ